MFDHSMFIHLTDLHSHATVEKVLDALEPILKSRGMERDFVEIEHGVMPEGVADCDEVIVLVNSDGCPKEVYVGTSGDADSSLYAAAEQSAKQLSALSEPSRIEICNHDADVGNDFSIVWIGEGEKLKVAQREYALTHTLALLRYAGLTETQLTGVSMLVNTLPYGTEENKQLWQITANSSSDEGSESHDYLNEEAFKQIWVSAGNEQVASKRAHALKESIDLLKDAGLTDDQLNTISYLVSTLPFEAQSVAEAPVLPAPATERRERQRG